MYFKKFTKIKSRIIRNKTMISFHKFWKNNLSGKEPSYGEVCSIEIDESKIHEAKLMTDADKVKLESKIRQIVNYSNDAELTAYNELSQVCNDVDAKSGDHDELMQKLQDAINKLSQTIADNTEHTINLASPSQVGELFFDILKIPFKGEKKSVAKNVIKGLLKERNEDGT